MPWVTVGPPQAEREADREHAVAEPELRRAPERNGDEVRQRATRMIARSRSAAVPITVPADRLRVTPVVEGDRERAGALARRGCS